MRFSVPASFPNYAQILDVFNHNGGIEAGKTSSSPLIQTDILPTATQSLKRTLTSVSFTASLGFFTNTSVNAISGALGDIKAALILPPEAGQLQTTQTVGFPPTTQARPNPADTSLEVTLWNEGNNDMPPSFSNLNLSPPYNLQPAQLLSISGSVIPQTPVDITPGQESAVALWMNPSTYATNTTGFGFVGMFLQFARYVVAYEEDYNPVIRGSQPPR